MRLERRFSNPRGLSMSRHRSFTTAIAVMLLAAPLAAQNVSQNTAVENAAPVTVSTPASVPSAAADAAPATSLAPTRANATSGVRLNASAATTLPSAEPSGRSRSPAMMIVGGVALLVGAVVGGTPGTIIMIGGGVVGLFGLWNYLN